MKPGPIFCLLVPAVLLVTPAFADGKADCLDAAASSAGVRVAPMVGAGRGGIAVQGSW
jgi:hypothetical protein